MYRLLTWKGQMDFTWSCMLCTRQFIGVVINSSRTLAPTYYSSCWKASQTAENKIDFKKSGFASVFLSTRIYAMRSDQYSTLDSLLLPGRRHHTLGTLSVTTTNELGVLFCQVDKIRPDATITPSIRKNFT